MISRANMLLNSACLVGLLVACSVGTQAQTTTVRRLVLEDTARTESSYNTVTLRKPTAGSSYSLTLPPELLSASQQVLVADTLGVMRSINFPTPGAYLMTNAAGLIVTAVDSQSVNGTWHYIGNGGSQYPTYTLGTTSNNPFQLMANNYNAMRLTGGSAPKIGFHANNASFGGGRQGESNVNAFGGAANSAPVADSCAAVGGLSNTVNTTTGNVALGGRANQVVKSVIENPESSVSIAGRGNILNSNSPGGSGSIAFGRVMLGGLDVDGSSIRNVVHGGSVGGYTSRLTAGSTMLGGVSNTATEPNGEFLALVGSEGNGPVNLGAFGAPVGWYNSTVFLSANACRQDYTNCGWSMTAHVGAVGNRFTNGLINQNLYNVSAFASARDTLRGSTVAAISSREISQFGIGSSLGAAAGRTSAASIASEGGSASAIGSRMLSLAAIGRAGASFCSGPGSDPFDEPVVVASTGANLANNRCGVAAGTISVLASTSVTSLNASNSCIVSSGLINASVLNPPLYTNGVSNIVIAGGSGHTASGTSYGSIVGGQGHVTSGTPTASVVLGGRNASFTAARSWTFSAAPAAVSATASIFSLFDADVYTTPSGAMPTPAVYFFEPSTSGTQSTALQTAAQTQDITYTLPSAAPSANGSVLVAQTNGTLSWRANVPQPFVGRIATNGAAAQVIAVAGKAANTQVVVTYEGPDANVVETWVNQNIAGSFQVNYTVAPPAGSFVNYQVIP